MMRGKAQIGATRLMTVRIPSRRPRLIKKKDPDLQGLRVGLGEGEVMVCWGLRRGGSMP